MELGSSFEKRKTDRVPHEALVRFSAGGEEDYHQARMFNYSSTGMYLELNYPPPKLGASLLIEVLDDSEPLSSGWFEETPPKTCYYAKVIWKKNLTQSKAQYGVGLRYLSSTQPEK